MQLTKEGKHTKWVKYMNSKDLYVTPMLISGCSLEISHLFKFLFHQAQQTLSCLFLSSFWTVKIFPTGWAGTSLRSRSEQLTKKKWCLMRATGCEAVMGPIEGTEIYGFVGGAWHGLAPLWCHVTALHRQRRFSLLDSAPRVNTLSGSSAETPRLLPREAAGRRREVALFLSARPFFLCLALTWQSTWGDYVGYLGGGTLRIGGVLNAARAGNHFAFESFALNNNAFVCLLAVVLIPLTVDVMCHGTPTHQ